MIQIDLNQFKSLNAASFSHKVSITEFKPASFSHKVSLVEFKPAPFRLVRQVILYSSS